ncbi:MAG: translocation/assembly module TamB domain-containing protein [Deltaproteobacteria bacterium]
MTPASAPPLPASRWRRAARALGWCAVFLASTLLGLLLHSDTPALREALTRAVNRGLAGQFRGHLSIGPIERLGASRATLGGLELRDEHGAPLVSLAGVKLGYHPWQWLGPLLLGAGTPVRFEHLRVERSRLVLSSDAETGTWALERALQSPRPPSGKGKRAPPPRYSLAEVELGELEVVLDHPSVGHVEAVVHHVRASAELAGSESSVTVQRFGLRLLAGKNVPLDGTGSLRLSPHGYAEGTFHGFVDGTEIDAAATLDSSAAAGATVAWADSQLHLRIAVPRAQSEQLRRRWPSWPLESDVSAQLTAQGPARALQVEAHLSAQQSQVDAHGEVELSGQPKARLELAAHALDARLFWSNAPSTDITAQARVQLEQGARGVLAEVTGTTQPTHIGELPLPGSQFNLQLGDQIAGKLELADARGRIVVQLVGSGPDSSHLELHASEVALEAWPELRGRVRGRVDVSARADLAGERLSGSLDGKLTRLELGIVRAVDARIEGTFAGLLGDAQGLELRSTIHAKGVELGPLSFESAHWSSRGSLSQTSFDATLKTAAGARSSLGGKLTLGDTLTFSDLNATWSDRDLELAAEVSYFAPEQRVLRVARFQISGGVGKLRGSGRLEPGLVDLSLDADGLDTGRLARTFGAAHVGLSGRVTGHAALATHARDTRGNIDLKLAQFGIRDLALGTLNVQATLQDRRIVASAQSSESPLGQLDARVTAALDGAVLEAASWSRATGEGSLHLKQLPLWPLGLALPKQLPVRELAGQLDVALQLERTDPKELPSAFLQASTNELSFSIASGPDHGSAATTFDQFTLHTSASVDGHTGHGAATLLLTDPRGALVTTSGSLQLELRRLLENPEGVLEQLLRTPLDALLRLHARPLSQLPAPWSLAGSSGSVEGTLQLSGSLAEPTLDLAFAGRNLLSGASVGSEPLDVTGLLHLVPNAGKLTGRAEATRGNQSLVSARLTGRLQNPSGARGLSALALGAWEPSELSAAAMLNGVPLELWPAAAREHVDARLYGSVSFERRGAELRRGAQIEIGGLSVNGHAIGNGRLTLASDASGSRAELQLGSGAHRLAARLQGVAPTAEEPEPALTGSVEAHDFEVASLSPLVSGILSRLDGALDADARVELRPETGKDWYLGITGRAELRDASAQLDLFGLQLRDLRAHLQARSTPEYTVLVIDPVEAKSRSRSDNVHGQAELWLAGTRVVNGEAQLVLNDVPLSLKNAARGTVRGRLQGQLERQPDHMALNVKVPELRMQLPTASTRSLISLEPDPEIHVGNEVALPPARTSSALLWRMKFEIGNAVRVERADLSLPLSGAPELEYREEVRPSGRIEVRTGGRLTLFDQNFSIDHGTLQFEPDQPDNPRIDVTASWRAPDGTTVYVDITGRAQEASVLTRDDRGLQDVERFYLLTGGPSPGAGAVASSLAGTNGGEVALGQTFSLGINQLLRESVGNVAVSIGTSDDRPSYSASVRLSDRLTFQGSFRPPSEAKREENSSDLTGSLDYQISRRWLLRTELGTTGGAFDLLWSHRY